MVSVILCQGGAKRDTDSGINPSFENNYHLSMSAAYIEQIEAANQLFSGALQTGMLVPI